MGRTQHPGVAMRLHSVDFFRGLALTIVLLDHVDLWARPAGFFRDWTLMGLGFSDAAEAFVFLSGFTFAWVYGRRLARDGFLSCQKRVLVRASQIYGGYLATVAIVASLGLLLRNTPASLYPVLLTRAVDDLTTELQWRTGVPERGCRAAGLRGGCATSLEVLSGRFSKASPGGRKQ